MPDYTKEHRPEKGKGTTRYWLDNDRVMHSYGIEGPVHGAHAPTFRFYLNDYAKDQRHCYFVGSRLMGADPVTFRVLNYTYALDKHHVYAMGKKAKDADPYTFVVCDDGIRYIETHTYCTGYGKDQNRVFYVEQVTPSWVRKAKPESFVSLNDGHFGKDDSFVFSGRFVLQGARVGQWKKIGSYYSRDDNRVFYFNRPIIAADPLSFEVAPTKFSPVARDKKNYYCCHDIVDKSEFLKNVACPSCFEVPEIALSDPHWQTSTAIGLAQAIYDQRAFDRMPILADALEDAGCTNEEVLAHCRGEGPHVRGCWVVDMLLARREGL
jgi:hypothetical protein